MGLPFSALLVGGIVLALGLGSGERLSGRRSVARTVCVGLRQRIDEVDGDARKTADRCRPTNGGCSEAMMRGGGGMGTDHEEFAAAARALDEVFIRHANAGNLDRLVAACYAEDALVLPPNLPLVQGRGRGPGAVRRCSRPGPAPWSRETAPIHGTGDLGYGVGGYAWAIRHPTTDLARETGKRLLVYRRQEDGNWKIAVDMFSSDLPAG